MLDSFLNNTSAWLQLDRGLDLPLLFEAEAYISELRCYLRFIFVSKYVNVLTLKCQISILIVLLLYKYIVCSTCRYT